MSTDSILDDYYTRAQLAAELKKSERTIKRWDDERTGPPVTYNGREPLYRKDSARAWLKAKERPAVRERRRRP
jgi:hypothetical protein